MKGMEGVKTALRTEDVFHVGATVEIRVSKHGRGMAILSQ